MRRLVVLAVGGLLAGCPAPDTVPTPVPSSAASAPASPSPAPAQPLRGLVGTFSHGAVEPQAMAVDGRDHLFVLGPNGVYEVEPSGRTRLLAVPKWGLNFSDEDRRTQLAEPAAIAVGPDGTVFVPGAKRLYRIRPDGTLNSLPGPTQTYQLQSAVADGRGNLYVALQHENFIWRLTPDGAAGPFAGRPGRTMGETEGFVDGPGADARFSRPSDLTVDAQGNVYVADSGNGAIRKLTPEGVVSTVFGQPRPPLPPSPSPGGATPSPLASLPPFVGVERLALAPEGGFYAVSANKLLRIGADGRVSLLAGGDDICDRPALLAEEAPSPASPCFAEGQGAEARFDRPTDLAVTTQGTLFVVDSRNRRIRRVE